MQLHYWPALWLDRQTPGWLLSWSQDQDWKFQANQRVQITIALCVSSAKAKYCNLKLMMETAKHISRCCVYCRCYVTFHWPGKIAVYDWIKEETMFPTSHQREKCNNHSGQKTSKNKRAKNQQRTCSQWIHSIHTLWASTGTFIVQSAQFHTSSLGSWHVCVTITVDSTQKTSKIQTLTAEKSFQFGGLLQTFCCPISCSVGFFFFYFLPSGYTSVNKCVQSEPRENQSASQPSLCSSRVMPLYQTQVWKQRTCAVNATALLPLRITVHRTRAVYLAVIVTSPWINVVGLIRELTDICVFTSTL